MSKIQLLRIKNEKHSYLVEVRNEAGEIRDEWLEKGHIEFIDPDFFHREIDDCSYASPQQQVPPPDSPPPVSPPLVSISPVSHPPVSLPLASPPVRPDALICAHCHSQFKRRDHLKVGLCK